MGLDLEVPWLGSCLFHRLLYLVRWHLHRFMWALKLSGHTLLTKTKEDKGGSHFWCHLCLSGDNFLPDWVNGLI